MTVAMRENLIFGRLLESDVRQSAGERLWMGCDFRHWETLTNPRET
jgi:hypothetical protein